MWWNFRTLIQPDAGNMGEQDLYLDISMKELAQLNGPQYASNSTGQIVVESKKEMKKRGLHSPDRAEAMLLAVYESAKNPVIVAPMALGQANPWMSMR